MDSATSVVILLAQGVVFGSFCGFIAAQKSRNSISWFFLGFFFSLIAMLALIAVPPLGKKESAPEHVGHESDQQNIESVALAFVLFFGIIIFLIFFALMIGGNL